MIATTLTDKGRSMSESYLGEFEQMVLIVILRLNDEAYGMSIMEELERRVGLAGSGDQFAGDSQRARDDARRSILADAAIVEDLIRARYGSDHRSRAARDARGMAHTLLSTQNVAYRDSRLVGLPDRLAP